jgi:hypothetical protein
MGHGRVVIVDGEHGDDRISTRRTGSASSTRTVTTASTAAPDIEQTVACSDR